MIRCGTQSGMALISVLWLMLLLTMLAASGTGSARSQLQQAHADLVATQRKYDEQSALYIVIASARKTSCTEVPRNIEFESGLVLVACSAETARLNINHAGYAELSRLFSALDIDSDKASALSDAILDWRDSDSERRSQGAEVNDYLQQGYSNGPANRAFTAVSELRNVFGMTPSIYRKVASYLSVYGRDGRLSVMHMPEPVFASLSGSEHYNFQTFQQVREENSQRMQNRFPLLNERQLDFEPATLLRISVHSTSDNQVTGQLEAVVDIAAGKSRIQHWMQGRVL